MRIAGHRFSSCWLSFLALFCGLSRAPAKDTNDLLNLSPWSRTTNVRIGAGYKDNILLRSFAPIDGFFLSSELEFFLFRIPVDGTQVALFLNGEDIHYLDPKGVDKEQTLTALASIKKDFARSWKTGLALQYLYQDQVFDVSRIEDPTVGLQFNTLRAQGHGFAARPSLLRELNNQQQVELEFAVHRQDFDEPLADYWEGGPKIILSDEYGANARVSLSYEFLRRDFDNKTQRTVTGQELAGTSLRFFRHEWQLAWQHAWDRKRRWRSTTKLSFLKNNDNGSDWFEFAGYRASMEMRYVANSWEARLRTLYYHYSYPVQTVSDTDLDKRARDGYSFTLQGERKLGKAFKVLGQFEHEHAFSNRPDEGYDVNTFRIGVDWAF
ncbi:MAG TPA: hypothetical protein VJW76_01765 [Verrucomicrobiae bacterium]|nr:hypothetical protein [Verrucomicrobiae bacterium]